jgi:hypothetical protein
MKTAIILITFLGLISTAAFTQQKDRVKPETYSRKLPPDKRFVYPGLPSFADSIRKPFPGWYPRSFTNRRLPGDNMPCIKPEGYYPMIVIKPDTTINYTLLIRRP